jgi:cell division protein ZapE
MFFKDFFNQTMNKSGIVQDAQQKECVELVSKIIDGWNQQNIFFNLLKSVFKKSNLFQGIYLYGSVGSGKTMILNTLFDYLDQKRTLRIHFKLFMLDLQKIGYEKKIKQCSQLKYILLDELEIIDIADALIIKRFFEALSQKGVKIMITSNLEPKQLYKDGLHYDRFEPFIPYLIKNFALIQLNNGLDYRLAQTHHKKANFDKKNKEEKKLVIHDKIIPYILTEGLMIFKFNNLCEESLGPIHYEELSQQSHCIYIENIPSFNKENMDSLRRFITLVDLFYDQKKVIKMIASPYLNIQESLSLPLERLQSRLIEMYNQKNIF